MMIAGSDLFSWGYMLPIEHVFEDISKTLGLEDIRVPPASEIQQVRQRLLLEQSSLSSQVDVVPMSNDPHGLDKTNYSPDVMGRVMEASIESSGIQKDAPVCQDQSDSVAQPIGNEHWALIGTEASLSHPEDDIPQPLASWRPDGYTVPLKSSRSSSVSGLRSEQESGTNLSSYGHESLAELQQHVFQGIQKGQVGDRNNRAEVGLIHPESSLIASGAVPHSAQDGLSHASSDRNPFRAQNIKLSASNQVESHRMIEPPFQHNTHRNARHFQSTQPDSILAPFNTNETEFFVPGRVSCSAYAHNPQYLLNAGLCIPLASPSW
jgi:hypothetical protein